MYILYNEDGSINKINLTDYIQQGNNNVNSIFVAIIGKPNTEWSVSAYFKLPSGDVEGPITGSPSTQTINDVLYYGWVLPITSEITKEEGIVKFALSVLNLQSQKLFTYQGKLVINPSDVIPEETNINVAQYESLVQLVLGIADDYVTREQLNDVLNGIESELEQLDVGQGV